MATNFYCIFSSGKMKEKGLARGAYLLGVRGSAGPGRGRRASRSGRRVFAARRSSRPPSVAQAPPLFVASTWSCRQDGRYFIWALEPTHPEASQAFTLSIYLSSSICLYLCLSISIFLPFDSIDKREVIIFGYLKQPTLRYSKHVLSLSRSICPYLSIYPYLSVYSYLCFTKLYWKNARYFLWILKQRHPKYLFSLFIAVYLSISIILSLSIHLPHLTSTSPCHIISTPST